MTYSAACKLLSSCHRYDLVIPAYGQIEITWKDPKTGKVVATGVGNIDMEYWASHEGVDVDSGQVAIKTARKTHFFDIHRDDYNELLEVGVAQVRKIKPPEEDDE